MPITNYTELQSAVAGWLHETSLTADIVNFITLAESRINRRVRLLQQQTEVTDSYDPAGASRFIAFPAGFIELLDLTIKKPSESDLEYRQVRYTPSDRIQEEYDTTTGEPRFYTLKSQIEFERLPDVIYTLKIHYLKKWDIATDTTNWLLTNYPDVYLYGALLEAAPFLEDDKRIPIWGQLLESAFEDVDEVDQRNRDDEILSVKDLAEMNNNYGYDINRDR